MLSIQQRLESQSITLPSEFYNHIEHYKILLNKWNKVHNLSGIKSEEQLDDFIIDAITPVSFLPSVKTAMDIGTGAGFPGMILAMGMPETHFTLVEPLAKRASFLQFVKADLGLNNVDVKAVRVEHLEPSVFDLITSRAVTDTQMLLTLSKPFSTLETQFLFYKGERVYDEVDSSLNYTIIEKEKRHYLLIKR